MPALLDVPCMVLSHVTSRTCLYRQGDDGRRKGEILALDNCLPLCLSACLLACSLDCLAAREEKADRQTE